MKQYFLMLFFFLLFLQLKAQWSSKKDSIPAFPGAEGFGKYATGGRGGMVYIVTNLNDSGPGSLRWALEAQGPRTVVFEVSGNIELQSPLRVRNSDLTIAGQSAPGEGITITNYRLHASNMNNLIIRFIRFRPGDVTGMENQAGFGAFMDNVIFDHCTFSWATDEIATFYKVRNFTMQFCIMSEALNNSVHSKGPHGYGTITGGKNVSWHHNLITHAVERMTMFDHPLLYKSPQEILDWRGVTDFRNNVIYNWNRRASSMGAEGTFNIINNYYKPGPATTSIARNRILAPQRIIDVADYGKFFLHGNSLYGNPEVSQDNWKGARLENDELTKQFLESVKVFSPFHIPEGIYEKTYSAQEAFERVLAHAGASLFRDPVDKRIIEETRNGKYTFEGSNGSTGGIIDSQKDVGGWPELKSLTAPKDTDRDGMPDDWEMANGLDPNKADNNGHNLHPHYTNLEVYLNNLVSHIMEVPNEVKIPESPILIGPENLQISPSGKIALKWSKPKDAELYRVQVSKDPDFKTKQFDLYNIPTETVSVDIKESGIFYWRVNASNKVGIGEFSASWKFETVELPSPPQLINPNTNQENTDTNIHFKWDPTPRADSYRIQVSLFRDFSQRILDRSNVTRTDFELENLEEGKTYYWRVRATNLAGNSPYSEIREFHTKKSLAIPSIPQLVSPGSSAMVNGKLINFEWSTAERAEKYEIQVSKFSNFSQTHVYQNNSLSQNQIAVENLEPDQIYFWRVRATNESGKSAFSAIRNFRTEPLPALNAAILISPKDGFTSDINNIDFFWGKVEEAENYQLELSKDSTFRNQVLRFSGIQEQRFFLDSLERDNKYFWRVMAHGKRPSSQSKIWSFRVREDLKMVSAHNSTIEISVYPNPFDRIINLEFSKAIEGNLSISLIDVKGIQVYDFRIENVKEILYLEIPKDLPKGIYILKIQGFGIFQSKKLSKK